MRVNAILALALLPTLSSAQPHSITDYGAVAAIDTHAQALVNGVAFAAAVSAANASAPGSRSVLVPEGSVFAFLPSAATLPGVSDVTIFIEGELSVFTANLSAYPGYPNSWVPLSFQGSSGLTLASDTGHGIINGRGNLWWWYAILVADDRPNLLEISGSGITLYGVTFLNSPAWHVWLAPVSHATITNCTVRVDIEDQVDVYRYTGASSTTDSLVNVLRAAEVLGLASDADVHTWVARGGSIADRTRRGDASLLAARRAAIPQMVREQPWWDVSWDITPPIPMIYALNTDGFDFSGVNVSVTNCSVTNFDDSVCVKPAGGTAATGGCTRDVYIADIDVTYGVGVSMGSVPPDVGGNCIDNVLAQRLTFDTPLKAMYVKPNPSHVGGASGAISNVIYEDVVIRDALWFPIWVGTQQQHQPGSAGTGCPFYFPLWNSTCPTDPEVSLSNLTFRRVAIFNGLMSPGILIANASNPGVGFVFDGVITHNRSGWPVEGGYLTQHIGGVATGGTSPVPPGFTVV